MSSFFGGGSLIMTKIHFWIKRICIINHYGPCSPVSDLSFLRPPSWEFSSAYEEADLVGQGGGACWPDPKRCYLKASFCCLKTHCQHACVHLLVLKWVRPFWMLRWWTWCKAAAAAAAAARVRGGCHSAASVCEFMWVFARFPLHVTHLLIDHTVLYSVEVSMPTQPVARQKMRTHSLEIKGSAPFFSRLSALCAETKWKYWDIRRENIAEQLFLIFFIRFSHATLLCKLTPKQHARGSTPFFKCCCRLDDWNFIKINFLFF